MKNTDPQIYKLIQKENKRQAETLMMIPSENYASIAVQQAVGSCLSNKYAEGYSKKRYYQGQKYIDKIETLVIKRAKKAFKVPHANVQALSGSPANLAVYFALLKPGNKIMGLSLSHGGHLTHGAKVSASGIYYNSVFYGLGKNGLMDYKEIEKIALKEKPRLIIAGITAYPKVLDWKKFAVIAKKTDAWLMADISHLAGLIVGGVYPSPVPHVHVVTTTTHKTLRGPRGAIIMATRKGLQKNKNLAKKIDKAVFPGLQGGPHINSIAGIGVALKEAETEQFKKYAKQIVKNCQALAKELKKQDFNLVTNGTNTHLILIDLQNFKITGNLAAEALEAAGIVVNKNAVPNDPNPPFFPSGLRLGTPGITTRGMKEKEMKIIAQWIGKIVKTAAKKKHIAKIKEIDIIKKQVKKLCKEFPCPKNHK